jgi:hypothetical protein
MRHITSCYMPTSRINSSPRFKITLVHFITIVEGCAGAALDYRSTCEAPQALRGQSKDV